MAYSRSLIRPSVSSLALLLAALLPACGDAASGGSTQAVGSPGQGSPVPVASAQSATPLPPEVAAAPAPEPAPLPVASDPVAAVEPPAVQLPAVDPPGAVAMPVAEPPAALEPPAEPQEMEPPVEAEPEVMEPPVPVEPPAEPPEMMEVEPEPPVEPEPMEPEPMEPEPMAPVPPEEIMGEPGNADGVDGFASIDGHGRNGTSGGLGGEEVSVSNFAELKAAVSDNVPRIVKINGTISGADGAMLDVGSNKTLLGSGGGATIDGFGFDINGWTPVQLEQFGTKTCDPKYLGMYPRVNNIIIRNITFKGAPDDSINVQCYSHHVWIDHCTFHKANDGSLDVKRGSDLVTITWNRFTGTDKTMLLGHSANNGDQDRGYLRATYHHNFFDGTNTRTPRVRFGYAHVYNNYVDSNDYFLGLGIEANIYAEGNYVEGAKTLTQTFTASTGYSLTWAGSNHYDEGSITRAGDSKKTKKDWLDANGSVSKPGDYNYSVDSAGSIPNSVKGGAGAGKL